MRWFTPYNCYRPYTMKSPLFILSLTLLHTACTTSGSPVNSLSPAATQQAILDTHNRIRTHVGVPPLIWSNKMSEYAQKWARHLANNNGCRMQHRATAGSNPLKAGENIYWASPLRWSDGHTEIQTISPSKVVHAWASEKADYHYANNSCNPGKQCGHYTQIVWHSTTEVGCGMSLCPDKAHIWVCNYNPAGNWVGKKPY